MKVLVINQYNSDNLGDKLLNEMICNQIKENGIKYKNVGFAQMTPQDIEYDNKMGKSKISILKRITLPFLKYILVYKRKIKIVQTKISDEKIDYMIIGGGQLIKHNSVFLYCLRAWINYAVKKKIKVYLFGVSIDNEINIYEKYMYKKAFKHISYFNVREKQSQKLLMKIFKIKADYSPDIAFTYINKNKKNIKKKNNKIVVMPYDYKTLKYTFKAKISKKDYYKIILDKISNISNDKKNIVLTATTSSDLCECYNMSNYLNKIGIRNEIIISKKISDFVKIIEDSEMIITGRMHAMIIGLLFNCTINPLIVSNKISTFCSAFINNKETNISNVSKFAKQGLDVIIKEINE